MQFSSLPLRKIIAMQHKVNNITLQTYDTNSILRFKKAASIPFTWILILITEL